MSEQSVVERKLKKEVKAGRQVYVITPLVFRIGKDGFERCGKRMGAFCGPYFQSLPWVCYMGECREPTKTAFMRAFLEGVYDILVSTTVVEVGVDVPNATVMVVQHAERFGLAQLHQLRGRVGRGKSESYCYLMCEHVSDDARERLCYYGANDGWFPYCRKGSGNPRAGRFFRDGARPVRHCLSTLI